MTTNRKLVFTNDYYYHIYNRGVEKRKIFLAKSDYQRLQLLLDFYRFENPPLRYSHVARLDSKKRFEVLQTLYGSPTQVDTLAWCLMPNHFHLLIKQTKDNGISTYLANVLNGYTRYFNTKHERVGPLFQGTFKARFIENDEQLLHISRYIHLNPVVSSLVEINKILTYPWSSLSAYLQPHQKIFVHTEMILSHFATSEEYLAFIQDQVSYAKNLKKLEDSLIDEE